MINQAKFNISIKESISLLKDVKIYKDIGPKTVGDYSEIFKKVCRQNKHIEIYNTIRDNLDYEIILQDDSFFQFSISDNYLRYSYIENPNYQYTKFDYLKLIFTEEEIYSFSEEDINELINENEFEQFLNEQEINSNLVYVRYDYDKKGYRPLLHSCSHLHVGLKEDLRLPLSVILTPLQFVIFCIKQAYFDQWQTYYESFEIEEFAGNLLSIKNQCIKITDNNIWKEIEKNELYII